MTSVEQIKEKLSILDVVGTYVKLHKAGKSYKGKSPFTNEKTPSFFVSPDRGMYYCFSSNQGGDMFTFIEKMEGVDFKGALKILAERAGIALVPENPRARDEREELFRIVEAATRFFEEGLRKSERAQSYLASRAVTDKSISLWRIGYAPPEWRTLLGHLEEKGHTREHIVRAGLAKGSEKSAEPYDVFRDRLLFPIADASGRVVAFSGRDLSGDADTPKYVNSPETPLFQKSHILFGYDKAKQAIRKFDFTLIVEGQFDLVLAHQAGYTNAVAISGTALSEEHITLLARLSNRAVLALDADRAGIASVMRASSLMLARGMDVKVARIEGGKDPADLVRDDPALLKTVVGKATHVVEFLVAVLKGEAPDERTFRLRVRDEVVPFVSRMPNRLDAEHFEGVLAEATGATREAIHYEVERARVEDDRTRETAVTPEVSPPRAVATERTANIVTYIHGVLLWLSSAGHQHISPERLREHFMHIVGEEKLQALDSLAPEEHNRAIFLAETAYGEDVASLVRALPELLRELDRRRLRTTLADLRALLREAESAGDRDGAQKHLAACHEVGQQLSKLEHENPYQTLT